MVYCRLNRLVLIICIAEVALLLLGIYGYTSAYSAQFAAIAGQSPTTLTGAGATLSYPLLSVVAANYSSTHPGVEINYQPLGSIAGISQLTVKTVDFCVTYPPMTQAQRNQVAPAIPLHIPESISEVVVAYNVPGISALNLTGGLIADIFRGNVTMWNDPRITTLNPGQHFPAKSINTWHMSEAEGTTFVFTSYLSLVSTAFSQTIGSGTSVTWPVGDSVLTDAGVAGAMKATLYSIGYMELSYAKQSDLSYASIQNSANKWIYPSQQSAQAAEEEYTQALPSSDGDWSGVNLLNKSGSDAYPLVTFTYLILYQDLSVLPSMDVAKAKALVSFVWFLVHNGQSLGSSLGYDPLPANVVSVDETGLRSVTYRGQALL